MAPSARIVPWAEIRQAYCESDEIVREIAARFQVCLRTVHKHAAAEGWPRRSERRGRPVGVTGPLAAGGGDPAWKARVTLEKRLYQVMIRKLAKLEERTESGQAVSPADNEREMREFGTMIRGFEKVKEIGAGDGNSGESGIRSPLGAAVDTERMRQEIADRLERLHRRWKSERNPG